MKSLKPLIRSSLFLLTIILFVYGIIAAKQFLFPLAIGAMFAYLLYPIANYLEKHRFPRILAVLASIAFALIIIGVIFFLFYRQMSNMFADFDALKENANTNIELLQHNLENLLGLQDNRLEQFLKTQVDQFFQGNSGGLGKAFSTTTGTILKLILLPVYVFLFLYYRTKFAYFILKIVRKEQKPVAIKILRDISTVAARYMGGV
ncbi:MAG: AI-2E family transporter, partial [Bacteroidales bacterium]